MRFGLTHVGYRVLKNPASSAVKVSFRIGLEEIFEKHL